MLLDGDGEGDVTVGEGELPPFVSVVVQVTREEAYVTHCCCGWGGVVTS